MSRTTATLPQPHVALATGYDFMAAPGRRGRPGVRLWRVLPWTNTPCRPSRTAAPAGYSWTATQLTTDLSCSHHDLVFLGAHFSANNLLAGDDATTLTTNTFAGHGQPLDNSLVLSAGCHSGYNIDAADGIPDVTDDLAWPQAFTEAGATLIAGTGYQYGDSNYVAYSDQVYVDLANSSTTGRPRGRGDGGHRYGAAGRQAAVPLHPLTSSTASRRRPCCRSPSTGCPMLGLQETDQVARPPAPPASSAHRRPSRPVPAPPWAWTRRTCPRTLASTTLGTTPVQGYTYYSYPTAAPAHGRARGPGPARADRQRQRQRRDFARGRVHEPAPMPTGSGYQPADGGPGHRAEQRHRPVLLADVCSPRRRGTPTTYNTLLATEGAQNWLSPPCSTCPTRAGRPPPADLQQLGLSLFYDNNTTTAGGETPGPGRCPPRSPTSPAPSGATRSRCPPT